MTKTIIIGLDGATWDLLKSWAEEGKLSTLKKLMEEGVWGNLESTVPPVTGPAWVSFATGKNPGKHGIYDFVIPEDSLTKIRTVTSADTKGKTFYELLNSEGLSSILVNLPGSYPPKTSGITITSILTKGDAYVFPPTLCEEIPDLKKYRIVPDMSLLHNGEKTGYVDYINDIRNVEKIRFEVAKKLFITKDWGVFFILFSGTDWVQHILFDKLISHDLPKDHPALILYEEIDNYLNYFVEKLPKNCNLIILSDHGFRTYLGTLYLNKWLEQHNLLKLKTSSNKPVYHHKLAEEYDKANSNKKLRIPLPILKFALALKINRVYRIFQKLIPINFQVNVEPDVSNSLAYVISSESLGIYINSTERFKDGVVNMNEFEKIKYKLSKELKELKFNGKKIFGNVWFRDEIHFGPQVDIGPDILFLPNTHWPTSNITSSTILDNRPINHHDIKGIFLAYGPDIKKGVKIENVKIYDIAPTILNMFGIPIPKDIDGRVLKEIFKEESELAKREIKYQEIDERELIKEKIKSLKSLRRI